MGRVSLGSVLRVGVVMIALFVPGIASSAPPTPGNLSGPATDDDGDFVLTWSPVSGATYYRLKEFNALEETWKVSGTSFAAHRFDDGNYRFGVAACDASGCSSYTPKISVTVTLAKPRRPFPIVAPTLDDDGTYLVRIGPVALATSYHVQERVDLGTWTTLQNGPSAVVDVRGARPGIHEYRVNACNALGCSGFSPEVRVLVAVGAAAQIQIEGVVGETNASRQIQRVQTLATLVTDVFRTGNGSAQSAVRQAFLGHGIALTDSVAGCLGGQLVAGTCNQLLAYSSLSGLAEEIVERAVIENAIDRRPHIFSRRALLCRTGEQACDADFVFQVLRSHKQVVAPMMKDGRFGDVATRKPGYDDPDPVIHNGTVELGPFPDNPIVQLIDEGRRCIRNVTLEGHIFEPGYTERCVVETSAGVYIETQGLGAGNFATFNEVIGPILFAVLDLALRDIYRADRATYMDPSVDPVTGQPPIPCTATPAAFFTGGAGLFGFDVNLGTAPGWVYMYLDFYEVPDSISVTLGPTRSGSGRRCVRFFNPGFATKSPRTRVLLDAPFIGTLWEFRLSCPASNGALFTSEGPVFEPEACPGVYLPGAL